MAYLVTFNCTLLLSPYGSFAADASRRMFILDPGALAMAKQRIQQGDNTFRPGFEKLTRDADRALLNSSLSVIGKDISPRTGDKHDYVSLAPYWWPNPNTANGIPYVRRDGKINTERDKYPDKQNLDKIVAAVKTLALAYYFTRNEKYARHAATLLQVWFIDAETKMNPLRDEAKQSNLFAPLLQRAALRYNEPKYQTALGKLPGWRDDRRERLLYSSAGGLSPQK